MRRRGAFDKLKRGRQPYWWVDASKGPIQQGSSRFFLVSTHNFHSALIDLNSFFRLSPC
jgi:hypothetical protein